MASVSRSPCDTACHTRRTGRRLRLAADPGPFSVAALEPAPALLGLGAWRPAIRLATPDVQVFAIYPAGDGRRAAPDSSRPAEGPDRHRADLLRGAMPSRPQCHGRSRTNCCTRWARRTSTTARTGQPLAPQGLGDPALSPLYPQSTGEIMAGRIATSPGHGGDPGWPGPDRPVGPGTAREIGWLR